MKITLDAIDGQQFTLRLPREGDGREQVVALHTTRRLRGTYSQEPKTIRLAPVEADEIVGEIAWLIADGALRLVGPARLGATSLDLEIALDGRQPAATGVARCASVAVPALEVTAGDLDLRGAVTASALDARYDLPTDAWAIGAAGRELAALTVARPGLRVEATHLTVRGVDAAIGAAMTVAAAALEGEAIVLTVGEARISVASVSIRRLRVAREAGGLLVEAGEVTLRGVEVVAGERRGRIDEARLTAARYAPEGISVEGIEGDELDLVVALLDAHEPGADRPAAAPIAGASRRLGVDLPFLDLLDGRIEADTQVDVKLPVIKHRVAKHSARLDVTAGAIDFKQLEHGLSLLEDAILDFEVEDAALVLELDALLAKRTLLRWPLDEAGIERARRGAVRLRTLLQPTVDAMSTASDDDSPKVALRRVEIEGLLIDVGVRGGSTEPLAAGTVRFGREGVPAAAALRVQGRLEHDAAHEGERTELRVALDALDVGLEGLELGGRRVDLGGLTLAAIDDGVVTFRGFAPSAARATLRGLAVRSLRVGPPTAAR